MLASELIQAINKNWGIEVSDKIAQRLISEINDSEKIECVVDSNSNGMSGFSGIVFLMTERLLLINNSVFINVPIKTITNIEFVKGVSITTSGSTFVIKAGNDTYIISSNRNEMMNHMYNIICNKGNISTQVQETSSESAVGKMIFGIVLAVILCWFGYSLFH